MPNFIKIQGFWQYSPTFAGALWPTSLKLVKSGDLFDLLIEL